MATREGGRELPGRLLLGRQWEAVAGVAVSALAVLVTRLPLRTRHLLNWDAAQFALGLRHFDIVHHQPHPPGYPAYLLAGRLLLPLFGDPNQALVALSIGGEAAGVAGAFLFARHLFGAGAGLVTAGALVASPLFWYYGEAANTYALEPGLTLAVAWFAWRAWNGEEGAAVPAAVALAAAGALRPSLAVLLAPLVALAVLRLRSRRRLVHAGTAAAGVTAAWLIPMTVLAGGPLALWSASAALGGDVTASTAIWRAGPPGLLLTSEAVLRGMVWDLGLFSVVAVFGLLVAPRLGVPAGLPPGYGHFALAWTAPALATFLLVHIGQVAYVQVFTAAIFLVLGPALRATVRAAARPGWEPALAAGCAAAGCLLFMLPAHGSLAGTLREHDAYLDGLVAAVSREDPARTVLLTDAYASGNYRMAQVYLPAYGRVAVARGHGGGLGEAFGDVYTPAGMEAPGPLDLPPGADTFLFLDRTLVDRDVADPERLEVLTLAGPTRVYRWHGAPPRVHGGELWLGPALPSRRGLAP